MAGRLALRPYEEEASAFRVCSRPNWRFPGNLTQEIWLFPGVWATNLWELQGSYDFKNLESWSCKDR